MKGRKPDATQSSSVVASHIQVPAKSKGGLVCSDPGYAKTYYWDFPATEQR